MKRMIAAVILLLAVLCTAACGGTGEDAEMVKDKAGKTYVREKGGFGGDFSILLREDGTYTYYEGMLSSYIGAGTWTEDDGIITMKETGGYDFTFRFAVQGDCLVFIKEGSDRFIYVDVADGDRFVLSDGREEHPEADVSCVLVIEVNGKILYADLEDNPSAQALKEKLNSGPVTVQMSDYGGFEKVGDLPWELPRSDSQITAVPGDVILYLGNKITVYYGENSWNFTRLAHIGNATGEELLDALGEGDAVVKFYLEWGE